MFIPSRYSIYFISDRTYREPILLLTSSKDLKLLVGLVAFYHFTLTEISISSLFLYYHRR
jgi:hypothetical protein